MDGTCNSSGRERLGLAFTIDYLLYDKGKNTGSNKEQEGEALGRELLKPSPGLSTSPARSPPPERGDGGPSEEQQGERHDKPAQSYIALIAMAILESEDKKLLLGDIYQWIMNKHSHFRSKVASTLHFAIHAKTCSPSYFYRFFYIVCSGRGSFKSTNETRTSSWTFGVKIHQINFSCRQRLIGDVVSAAESESISIETHTPVLYSY
ncbi:UNVERIFIED_CONTAM: hypothetical protein FKN15_017739 [Acipenser sinensis]